MKAPDNLETNAPGLNPVGSLGEWEPDAFCKRFAPLAVELRRR